MRLFYYLILLPFSNLPSWVLYRISDVLYVIVYKMAGYRKGVVRKNIKNSFPNLSADRRYIIERQFYVHFCDLIVESIKAFSISKVEADKRMVQRNPEIINAFMASGRHVTMVGGHYGNWELFAVTVASGIRHQPVALFTRLSNKFMNEKVLKSRSRYGLLMRSYEQAKAIVEREGQKPVVVIFGSDQCPKFTQQPYWMEFLGQETAVHFGAENFARKYKTPVVYGVIHKVRRGYYEVEYTLICENPDDLAMGEITAKHTKLLETNIIEQPCYWLWTHKRWKRTRQDFEARASAAKVLSPEK